MDAMQRAKKLIGVLNFEECVILFEKLANGHPMMDLIFDRMELIDEKRFEKFLDS